MSDESEYDALLTLIDRTPVIRGLVCPVLCRRLHANSLILSYLTFVQVPFDLVVGVISTRKDRGDGDGRERRNVAEMHDEERKYR